MITKQKNLQLIQMMRGIASLLVVLLHVSVLYTQTFGGHFLFDIFSFGGSGVDIFFVLSGFIITYTNSRNIAVPRAATGFVKRRFIRIFPIYWIIISVLLLVRVAFPSFYNTGMDMHPANLIGTYLLLPDHFMINGVSWSLTNELFFYLLFLIAFLLPSPRVSFVLMCIYMLVLLIPGIAGYDYSGGNILTQLLLFPMNTEFFMGVAIALVFEKLPAKMIMPCIIAGVVLFIAGAVLANCNIVLAGNAYNRVLLFGVPSFLLILGIVALETRRNFDLHSVFLSLGDASYSIYLFHLPVVAAFYKIVQKLGMKGDVLIHIMAALLIAGICIAGICIYKKLEFPLIRWLNRKLIKS